MLYTDGHCRRRLSAAAACAAPRLQLLRVVFVEQDEFLLVALSAGVVVWKDLDLLGPEVVVQPVLPHHSQALSANHLQEASSTVVSLNRPAEHQQKGGDTRRRAKS